MRVLMRILLALVAIAAPLAFAHAAPPRVAVLSPVQDSDAVKWKSAVVVNGGTVSATRLALVSTLIRAYRGVGWWGLMDDGALLVAENAPQALTSLKMRRLMTAVNSPTFTADRGYAFNGTSQYVDSGFNPATMATKMTAAGNGRLAAYERVNVAANAYVSGLFVGTSALALQPRRSAGAYNGAIMSGAASVGSSSDSRGYTAVSSPGTTTITFYQNGSSVTTGAVTQSGALPNGNIYIACRNNNGTPDSFRATTLGIVDWGAALLSAAQELAVYAANQVFMTAVGANV